MVWVSAYVGGVRAYTCPMNAYLHQPTTHPLEARPPQSIISPPTSSQGLQSVEATRRSEEPVSTSSSISCASQAWCRGVCV